MTSKFIKPHLLLISSGMSYEVTKLNLLVDLGSFPCVLLENDSLCSIRGIISYYHS